MQTFSVNPAEQIASEQDKHSSQEKRETTAGGRNKKARRKRIKLLKRYFPSARRILCVGARDDSEVQDIVDAGYDAQGIDVANESDLIRRIDAHTMDDHFCDGEFDVAYCCHSLEHMYDAHRVLRSLRRIASLGAIVTLPNGANAITPNTTHPTIYDVMLDCPRNLRELKQRPHLLQDFQSLEPCVVPCFERAKDYAEFNMVFQWQLQTYGEHYRESRRNYQEAENVPPLPRDLYAFDVEVTRPGEDSTSSPTAQRLLQLPTGYPNLIESLGASVSPRFEDRRMVWSPPQLDPEADCAKRLGGIHEIPELEQLCGVLVPQLEQNLFGAYAHVEGVYVYRTEPTSAPPRASWLWHTDNNPNEIIKIMVYLTDVTEQTGPFEFIRHKKTGEGCKLPSRRVDYRQWQSHHSRVSQDELAEWETKGFVPYPVTGPKGTVIVFDNNVIHRATVPTHDRRDVAVLMVRPAKRKLRPFVAPVRTGTFGDKSIFIDPNHTAVGRSPAQERLRPRRPFFMQLPWAAPATIRGS